MFDSLHSLLSGHSQSDNALEAWIRILQAQLIDLEPWETMLLQENSPLLLSILSQSKQNKLWMVHLQLKIICKIVLQPGF